MDISDYLSSRMATVVRNPQYNEESLNNNSQQTNGYAKPNLQLDVSRSMVIPPLNTGVSFSADLPRHTGYNAAFARGQQPAASQPQEVAQELASYLGVKHLPSTENIYNPRYVHMLDNLKKNQW